MNKEILKKEWQEFVESQIWQGENEYTKNIGVGNVAEWWLNKIDLAIAEERKNTLKEIEEEIGEDEAIPESIKGNLGEIYINGARQIEANARNQERQRIKQLIHQKLIK